MHLDLLNSTYVVYVTVHHHPRPLLLCLRLTFIADLYNYLFSTVPVDPRALLFTDIYSSLYSLLYFSHSAFEEVLISVYFSVRQSAMRLLIIASLYPTWSQVFATTNVVMELLRRHDNELFTHLEHISQQSVEMHAKDFVLDNIKRVSIQSYQCDLFILTILLPRQCCYLHFNYSVMLQSGA